MKVVIYLYACLLFFTSAVAQAVPKETQKRLSMTCFACHGELGKSPNPFWPNLGGQKKEYLVKQIQDFRSGERKNPIMSPMAATLSDEDIDAIATYFSELN